MLKKRPVFAYMTRLLANHRRETEIRNLHIIVGIKHDILWLEITVVDVEGVAIGDGACHLVHVPSRTRLVHLPALGDSVEELATCADFHDHEHPPLVKVNLRSVELDYVGVIQAPLRDHLLRKAPEKQRGHDFDCHCLISAHMMRHTHDTMSSIAQQTCGPKNELIFAVRGVHCTRR